MPSGQVSENIQSQEPGATLDVPGRRSKRSRHHHHQHKYDPPSEEEVANRLRHQREKYGKELEGLTVEDAIDFARIQDAPSVQVRKVVEAAAILLGLEPVQSKKGRKFSVVSFRQAQGIVQEPEFLSRLLSHARAAEPISESGMQILHSYITNPLLDPEHVEKVSWVSNVIWKYIRATYAEQLGSPISAVIRKARRVRRRSIDARGGGRNTLEELHRRSSNRSLQLAEVRARTAAARARSRSGSSWASFDGSSVRSGGGSDLESTDGKQYTDYDSASDSIQHRTLSRSSSRDSFADVAQGEYSSPPDSASDFSELAVSPVGHIPRYSNPRLRSRRRARRRRVSNYDDDSSADERVWSQPATPLAHRKRQHGSSDDLEARSARRPDLTISTIAGGSKDTLQRVSPRRHGRVLSPDDAGRAVASDTDSVGGGGGTASPNGSTGSKGSKSSKNSFRDRRGSGLLKPSRRQSEQQSERSDGRRRGRRSQGRGSSTRYRSVSPSARRGRGDESPLSARSNFSDAGYRKPRRTRPEIDETYADLVYASLRAAAAEALKQAQEASRAQANQDAGSGGSSASVRREKRRRPRSSGASTSRSKRTRTPTAKRHATGGSRTARAWVGSETASGGGGSTSSYGGTGTGTGTTGVMVDMDTNDVFSTSTGTRAFRRPRANVASQLRARESVQKRKKLEQRESFVPSSFTARTVPLSATLPQVLPRQNVASELRAREALQKRRALEKQEAQLREGLNGRRSRTKAPKTPRQSRASVLRRKAAMQKQEEKAIAEILKLPPKLAVRKMRSKSQGARPARSSASLSGESDVSSVMSGMSSGSVKLYKKPERGSKKKRKAKSRSYTPGAPVDRKQRNKEREQERRRRDRARQQRMEIEQGRRPDLQTTALTMRALKQFEDAQLLSHGGSHEERRKGATAAAAMAMAAAAAVKKNANSIEDMDGFHEEAAKLYHDFERELSAALDIASQDASSHNGDHLSLDSRETPPHTSRSAVDLRRGRRDSVHSALSVASEQEAEAARKRKKKKAAANRGWQSVGDVAPAKGGILAQFRPKSLGNTPASIKKRLRSKRKLKISLDEFTERLAQPRALAKGDDVDDTPVLHQLDYKVDVKNLVERLVQPTRAFASKHEEFDDEQPGSQRPAKKVDVEGLMARLLQPTESQLRKQGPDERPLTEEEKKVIEERERRSGRKVDVRDLTSRLQQPTVAQMMRHAEPQDDDLWDDDAHSQASMSTNRGKRINVEALTRRLLQPTVAYQMHLSDEREPEPDPELEKQVGRGRKVNVDRLTSRLMQPTVSRQRQLDDEEPEPKTPRGRVSSAAEVEKIINRLLQPTKSHSVRHGLEIEPIPEEPSTPKRRKKKRSMDLSRLMKPTKSSSRKTRAQSSAD